MRFFVFFYCLLQFIPAYASDINLGIAQASKDDQITITVENKSLQPVVIKQLELVLNNKFYVINWAGEVLNGHKKRFEFNVQLPDVAGSYAQRVNLYYFNDSKVFTLTDIGFFYYQEPFNLPTTDTIDGYSLQTGSLNLNSEQAEKWQIVLPREVTSRILESTEKKIRRYQVRGNYSGFSNNYPVFAVAEGIKDNRHYAQILKTTLQVKHGHNNAQRGWTPNYVLLLMFTLSVSIFVFSLSRFITNSRYVNSVLAYSSRLFWLSLSYYLLKNGPFFFSSSAVYLEQFASISPLQYSINFLYIVNDHLTGKNYTYFFHYFIDAYLWGFVILYPVYVYFFEPRQLEKDKYVNCLLWTLWPLLALLSKQHVSFKLLPLSSAGNLRPNELQSPVKKGFLILAVKLFFLPLLASWVINNIIHQWSLMQSFEWTFHQVNGFILALLILTDTSIFLAGYMFESYRAKNQIRSVEPTLLGWIVCLWCYPPFNEYSFAIFDYQLFPIHISIENWAKPIVLCSITILWGVFVWASLTLGLKASNLTNRGTVSNGPYRYCRHPAYTAKIMIWAIEAIFLGKYFFGLFMGFALIYFLRAWTEERHLVLDNDYRKYKEQVPYRFIPGIY